MIVLKKRFYLLSKAIRHPCLRLLTFMKYECHLWYPHQKLYNIKEHIQSKAEDIFCRHSIISHPVGRKHFYFYEKKGRP